MMQRRGFLIGTAVVAAVALAGCSGPAPEGEAGGGGVTIEHRYGVTEVAPDPERIVTVGLTEQDYPLAFGTVPVLTREWFGDQPGALWPWAAERAGDAETPGVLDVTTLDFEQIAAAAPDLILGMNSGMTQQEYDQLSNIAPVIAQPVDAADYGATWDDMTRTVGQVLGREADAEQMISELTAQLDEARATVDAQGQTGLLTSSIEGSLFVYPTGPAATFLTTMGLGLPPNAVAALGDPATAPPLQLSPERAEVIEADLVLLGLYDGATAEEVLSQPLVAPLRVAREGRVIALPESSLLNGALSFSSVLSLPIVLDELVPRMVTALDGDPATVPAPVT